MNAPGFGLRLPPCATPAEVAYFAQRAEEAGVGGVWLPDSQFLWRDAWTTAALVADRTERIGIGIAVTNFETRHVAVLANTIASLDELSGGRVRVAFGTGDSAVKLVGRAPTSLRGMRASFGVLRRLLAGDEVTWETEGRYGGRPVRLRHPANRHIPLYMAASGPKALALAGEIADGVIVAAGVAPHLVERALAFVREGAARAARPLADLDVHLAAYFLVTQVEADAVRHVKPLCLSMAQLGAAQALRSVGIDLDVPRVIGDIYPDVTHAQDWARAMEIADSYIDDASGDRFARGLTLAGTEEMVRRRMQDAAGEGVDAFYLLAPSSYELPHSQLAALTSWISGT